MPYELVHADCMEWLAKCPAANACFGRARFYRE